MSDPTTYHRIVLKFQSPFTKRGETGQYWTLKFSLSGSALTSSSDAAATALDLATDVLKFNSDGTSYVGWRYYAAGSSVNMWSGDFSPGTHTGNAEAYASGDDLNYQQLEVVALARCYVKQSSKGRPVYLMKHIHDVYSGDTAGNLATLNSGQLSHWNSGAGPDELVPVDPTTGQAGTGWSVHTALYTRQLRKGVKPPT